MRRVCPAQRQAVAIICITTIMSVYALKIDTLYVACCPERGVVSYGACQDEAFNNLHYELQEKEPIGGGEAYGEQ